MQGEVVTQVWGTDKVPSDNISDWTYGYSQPGPTVPTGSALRMVDINPGYRSAMHRTPGPLSLTEMRVPVAWGSNVFPTKTSILDSTAGSIVFG